MLPPSPPLLPLRRRGTWTNPSQSLHQAREALEEIKRLTLQEELEPITLGYHSGSLISPSIEAHQSQLLFMADQNPPHHMPLSGEHIAPRFDSSKPREIRKFWEDIETHFERSGITDNERKPWVLRYVDSDTRDFWESFEEASLDEKTYEEFKAKINEYYPGADGTRRHTTAELLAYIDQALSDGIRDKDEYATFARGFMPKSQYLLKKEVISKNEQSQFLLGALRPNLRARVVRRLEIVCKDLEPDVAYPVGEIDKAIQFCLIGTTSSFTTSSTASDHPTIPTTLQKEQPEPSGTLTIKMKDLVRTLAQINTTMDRLSRTPPSGNSARPYEPPVCYFDGGPHVMRNCTALVEYEQDGKVKRDSRGKIILPNGVYLDSVPGRTMIKRVDEYHRQNPNQAAGLLVSLFSSKESTAAASYTPRSTPERQSYQYRSPRELNLEARRASLLKELESIKGHITRRKCAAAALTVAKAVRPTSERPSLRRTWERDPPLHLSYEENTTSTGNKDEGSSTPRTAYVEEVSEEEADPATGDREVFVSTRADRSREQERDLPSNVAKEPGRRTIKDRVEVVIPARPSKQVRIASPEVQPAPDQVEEVVPAPPVSEANAPSPEHPYAKARDATYVPPSTHNVASPYKPPYKTKEQSNPVYRNTAPVYDSTVVSKVAERSLDLPVMITHRELLSLSPEVCAIYREITSTR